MENKYLKIDCLFCIKKWSRMLPLAWHPLRTTTNRQFDSNMISSELTEYLSKTSFPSLTIHKSLFYSIIYLSVYLFCYPTNPHSLPGFPDGDVYWCSWRSDGRWEDVDEHAQLALLNARLEGVVQGSGLHVLGHQWHVHRGREAVEHVQGEALFCRTQVRVGWLHFLWNKWTNERINKWMNEWI